MPKAPLAAGASGDAVARLQNLLIQQGYQIRPSETDRKFFGPSTRQAVLQFQKKNGLLTSGTVDAKTAAKIDAIQSDLSSSPSWGQAGSVRDSASGRAGPASQSGRVPPRPTPPRAKAGKSRDGSPFSFVTDSRAGSESASTDDRAFLAFIEANPAGTVLDNLTKGSTAVKAALSATLNATLMSQLSAALTAKNLSVLAGLIEHMPSADLAAARSLSVRAFVKRQVDPMVAKYPAMQQAVDVEIATLSGTDTIGTLLTLNQPLASHPIFRGLVSQLQLSTLLATSPSLGSSQLQTDFITAYTASRGPINKFWSQLRSQNSGFTPAIVSELQLTLQLGTLTLNNVPLVQAIQNLRQQGTVTTLQDLVTLNATAWTNLITTPVDGEVVTIPASVSGATPQAKTATYVNAIMTALRRMFPTAALAQQLAQAPAITPALVRTVLNNNPGLDLTKRAPSNLNLTGLSADYQATASTSLAVLRQEINMFPGLDYKAAIGIGTSSTAALPTSFQNPIRTDVVSFLANSPSFDFRTTNIDAYIAANPTAFNGIAQGDQTALKTQLKTFQRIVRVTSDPKTVDTLMGEGFASAYAISSIPKGVFTRQYSGLLGGIDRATAIYNTAQYVDAQAANVYMRVRDVLNGFNPAFIGSFGAQAQNVLQQNIANWQALFGSTSYCTCAGCAAVDGPAAYFVDLLQFLGGSTPNVPGNTPLDVLVGNGNDIVGRRPDLAYLKLDCANTDTTLPYVDLVNEILESYVGYNVGTLRSALPESSNSTPSDATADQLRVNPEYTLDAAYVPLSNAFYPFTLPYDRFLTTARVYLESLGSSRYQVMQMFGLWGVTVSVKAANTGLLTLQLSNPSSAQSPFPANGTIVQIGNELVSPIVFHMATDKQTLTLTSLLPMSILDGTLIVANDSNYTLSNIVDPQAALAAEYLNISPNEYSLITGRDLSTTPFPPSETPNYEFFGYENQEQLTWKTTISQVPEFLQRTGLAFADLVCLLETQYLNPGQNIALLPGDTVCNLDTTTIAPLTDTTLSQIPCFLRLWKQLGWQLSELDKAIRAINSIPTSSAPSGTWISRTFIVAAAQLKQLQKILNLSVVQLMSLCANIDTDGRDSLYVRLFQNKAVINPVDAALQLTYLAPLPGLTAGSVPAPPVPLVAGTSVLQFNGAMTDAQKESALAWASNFSNSTAATVAVQNLYNQRWYSGTDVELSNGGQQPLLSAHLNTVMAALRVNAADLMAVAVDAGLIGSTGTWTSAANIIIGGDLRAAEANDRVTVTFTWNLSTVSVDCPVEVGDTAGSVAGRLAQLINTNLTLSSANISATVLGAVVSVFAPSALSSSLVLRPSVTPAGATETATISTQAVVGGTVKSGDVVGLTITSAIPGPSITVSYPVSANDTLNSIANELVTLINTNPTLSAAKISAAVAGAYINEGSIINLYGPAAWTSSQPPSTATETVTIGTGPMLNLTNLSSLYRYSVLAQALSLSVKDLISLKALTGVNPFTPAGTDSVTDPLVQFVQAAQTVASSKFSLAQLNYLYRAIPDAADSLPPLQATQDQLAVGLSAGLQKIATANAYTPDPSGETLRKKLAVLLPAEQAEPTMKLINGSAVYTSMDPLTSLPVNLTRQASQPCLTTLVAVGGTATKGDQVTLNLTLPSVAGSPFLLSYPVQRGDTPTSIAAALCAAFPKLIAGNAALMHISAFSSGSVVNISTPLALGPIGAWAATTTPALATTPNASETVTVSDAAIDEVFYLANVKIGVTGGNSVTVGDTVTMAAALYGVPGPKPSVAYTVQTGDTPSSIATNLSAQINKNQTLSAAGVSSTVAGAVITISTQLMLDPSITCGANVAPPTAATEQMSIVSGAPATVTLGGYVTPGDTAMLSISSTAFAGPPVSFSYPIGQSDTPTTIAAWFETQINNNPTLKPAGILANAIPAGTIPVVITISSSSSSQPSITCTANVTPPTTATELMAVAGPAPFTGNVYAPTTVTLSGNVTPGDTATLSIASAAFAGLPVSFSYPIGDTPSRIAASLAAQINASTILQGQRMFATVAGPVISITVPTTLSSSLTWTSNATNPGAVATEELTVVVGSAGAQTTVITVTVGTVGGSAVTATDLVTLSVATTSGAFAKQQVSHAVAGPDTLTTIAAGFAAQINSNPTLKAARISAGVVTNGTSPVITISCPPSLSPSQTWSYSITPSQAGQSVTETVTIAGSALKCVGPMSDATHSNLSALYNVSGSQFTNAVTDLYNQAQTILSQNLSFLAPAAGQAWNTPSQKLIDAPSSTLADRYDYVLENLLSYLQIMQSQSLVKQTLSQALNLDPTLVALLVEGDPTTAARALLPSNTITTQPTQPAILDFLGGLLAKYYSGTNLTTPLQTQIDPGISLNGAETAFGSAQWLGRIVSPTTDTYTFNFSVPPGAAGGGQVQLWVDGQLLIDTVDTPNVQNPINLTAGQIYDFQLNFKTAAAASPAPYQFQLQWGTSSASQETIPPTAFVLGADPTSAQGTESYTFVQGGIYSTLSLLYRIALLVNGFSMKTDEVVYLSANSQKFAGVSPGTNSVPFSLKSLPLDNSYTQQAQLDTVAVALFDQWRRLNALYSFKASVPGGNTTVFDIFRAASASGNVTPPVSSAMAQTIQRATAWNATEFQTLAGAGGFGLVDTDFTDERALVQLASCLSLGSRLGISSKQLFEWANNLPDSQQALDIATTVKSKYDDTTWLQVGAPLNDKIRATSKKALIAHILTMQQIPSNVTNADALYEYFLIDVQMSTCMLTSRLVQATAAVQLFIQRCMMNLENGYSGTPALDVLPSQIDAAEWESWRKNYRVWQANREVFLYPENWIAPTLRDDRTPFFQELQNQLLQGPVTADNVKRAYLAYLQQLQEVSQLEMVGLCVDDHDSDPSNPYNTVHVFGRTGSPYTYYYRSLTQTWDNVGLDWVNVWSPWEKVDLDIQSDQLIPAVWNNRLYAFWPLFTESADPGAQQGSTTSQQGLAPSVLSAAQQVQSQITALGNYVQAATVDPFAIAGFGSSIQVLASAIANTLFPALQTALGAQTSLLNQSGQNSLAGFPGVMSTLISFLNNNNPLSLLDLSTISTFIQALTTDGNNIVNAVQAAQNPPASSQSPSPVMKSLQVQMAWSEYKQGAWTKKQVTSDRWTPTLLAQFNELSSTQFQATYSPNVPPFSQIAGTLNGLQVQTGFEGNLFFGTDISLGNLIVSMGFSIDIPYDERTAFPGFQPYFAGYYTCYDCGSAPELSDFLATDATNSGPTSLSNYYYHYGDPPWEPVGMQYNWGDGSLLMAPDGAVTLSNVLTLPDDSPAWLLPAPVQLYSSGYFQMNFYPPLFFLNAQRTYFVTQVQSSITYTPIVRFHTHYHPHIRDFIQALNQGGVDGLLTLQNQSLSDMLASHAYATSKQPEGVLAQNTLGEELHDDGLICYAPTSSTAGTQELQQLNMVDGSQVYFFSAFAPGTTPLYKLQWTPNTSGTGTDPYFGSTGDSSSGYLYTISPQERLNALNWYGYQDSVPGGIIGYVYGPQSPYAGTPGTVPLYRFSSNRFAEKYKPANCVATPYPKEDVDFSPEGAYSIYNWELFFHIPFLIATQLSQNQQFEDARKWFHYIFNPTNDSGGPVPNRYWNFWPFNEYTEVETLSDLLGNLDCPSSPEYDNLMNQVVQYQTNPFDPDAIARLRPLAYQKAVVMKYLDNLIAWGDSLFAQNTRESINEATQIYVLAQQILGPQPVEVPAQGPIPDNTYNDLRSGMDGLDNVLINLENGLLFCSGVGGAGQGSGGASVSNNSVASTFYFCIPPNENLLGYWDTVADRLYKIRHCMNIQGQVEQLALFAPPINPALLVAAQAAGVDLSSALSDINAALPYCRFSYVLGKALELCSEVRSLGGALLSAFEKQDAESLALLRANQELTLQNAILQIKQLQISEANANLQGLTATQAVTTYRQSYYQGLINAGLSAFETGQVSALTSSQEYKTIAQGVQLFGSLIGMLPDFDLGASGIASPVVTATFGGRQLSDVAAATGSMLNMIADAYAFQASMAGLSGQWDRRSQEWNFQLQTATLELQQIAQQINAANFRIQISQQDLSNQQIQINNASDVLNFLQTKYTNEDLYNWMVDQVSAVYFQCYQMAYDLAKRAESCFQFELGLPSSSYIQFGYWDSLKQGLLSGEKLYLDLKRLELAYMDRNKREYEITRNISLVLLDPFALITLKETGLCIVSLPEAFFDMDYPGHYMRRIKSLSLTIPCVTGPYFSVNCTLTLLQSKIRSSIQSSPQGDPYLESPVGSDPRFFYNYAATQSIATSMAQNDSGMFEVSFRDERYLPFEGGGVVSQWLVSMPQDCNSFDFETITDVIFNLKYTARDGGGGFGALARAAATLPGPQSQAGTSAPTGSFPMKQINLTRLFSLKHEFPTEWYQFMSPAASASTQTMSFRLTNERFPFQYRGKKISISQVQLFLQFKAVYPPFVPSSSTPQADYASSQLPVYLAASSSSGAATSLKGSLAGSQGVLNGMPFASIPFSSAAPISAPSAGQIQPWTLTINSSDIQSLPVSLQRVSTAGGGPFLNPEVIDDLFLVCQYMVQ